MSGQQRGVRANYILRRLHSFIHTTIRSSFILKKSTSVLSQRALWANQSWSFVSAGVWLVLTPRRRQKVQSLTVNPDDQKSSVLVVRDGDVETCPLARAVSGAGRLHLFVRGRGVLRAGARAGQEGAQGAIRLAVRSLLGQEELCGSGAGAGRDPLAPAAINRLLVGRKGDGKSVHHQVQLVWRPTATGKKRGFWVGTKNLRTYGQKESNLGGLVSSRLVVLK